MTIAEIETEVCPADGGSTHGYINDKERVLKRLSRIEGQVRGISRMVEDERYCIDVLTQISAATKALETVALGLLDLLHGRCLLPPQKRRRQRAHARQREHRGHDQGRGPFFSAIREFLLSARQHMLRHPRVACQA